VDPHFHALDSLVSKTYRYEILLRRTKAVLDLDHAYWVPMDPQDWKRDQAQEAMSHFVGLHDFKAFCAASSSARSTQREVLESTMRIQDLGRGLGHKVDLFFKGRGFLKQMVRNMAGLIFEIGSGLKSPNEVKRLLSNPHLTRQDAGVCLPAHGLTLVELEYLEPWGILRRGDKLF
jgi:tRNA pseudouridine38-40 synthase